MAGQGILILCICTVFLVKILRLTVGLGLDLGGLAGRCKPCASLIWYDFVFIRYWERGVYKQTSGALGMMALIFALVTIVAAAVAIHTYGEVTIVEPSLYGRSPSVKTVTNWPLIISCVSAGFYSIAFAALFMYVETTRNAVAKIANHLGIKEEELGNAQPTSQADEQEQPSASVTPSKGNIRRGQRSV